MRARLGCRFRAAWSCFTASAGALRTSSHAPSYAGSAGHFVGTVFVFGFGFGFGFVVALRFTFLFRCPAAIVLRHSITPRRSTHSENHVDIVLARHHHSCVFDTIGIGTAVVTGAQHQRAGRNGQDAVATWRGDAGVVLVVADGCGSAASSEVGARLGAALFARAAGGRLGERGVWEAARAEVGEALRRMLGGDERLVRECFLFTLVAAAITREGVEVWALGDGAYAFDGVMREVGPFEDNAPPYLAYDLLGDHREAFVAVAPEGTTSVVIATDGACELALSRFDDARFVKHPDALRRELALLARSAEHIDWDARRVVREPASVQDDCAVAVARWRLSS